MREEVRFSARILLLTVEVFGLLAFTHYSSVMISFLTFTSISHPISSFEDLLHSSSYTLGILRGTSTQDVLQVRTRIRMFVCFQAIIMNVPTYPSYIYISIYVFAYLHVYVKVSVEKYSSDRCTLYSLMSFSEETLMSPSEEDVC